MLKLYCLSGLGVDHRAFDTMVLPNVEMIHVPWIAPRKNETLESYAERLFHQTNPDSDYAILGVSFGGMIAQEWAKIQKPQQLLLISTTNHFQHIQPTLRIPGKIGLHRFLHPRLAILLGPLTHWFFGAKTTEDKQVLKAILKDTNPRFLRWAAGALLQWKSSEDLDAIRIHGNKDRMIGPPGNVDFVTNGGHFTVFSEGREIANFLDSSIK